MNTTTTTAWRSRWAAIGAAVAVTLGAGGIGLVSATSPADAVTYVPIEPCRLTDTRPAKGIGGRTTPIGTAETYVIDAHGDNGECENIPATATGLQTNVTALGATAATFLTFWAEGDRPNAASLNPTPGQPPVPNAVTTGITNTGQFRVFNPNGTVHIVIDIVGYYTDHNHDDRYYQKSEVDAALNDKADTSDTYTKTEVDAALDDKADTSDTYTKTEVDGAIDAAALSSEVTEFVSVPAAAFQARYSASAVQPLPNNKTTARTFIDGTGGDSTLLAGVSIPHGATIVSVAFALYDNGPSTLTGYLRRGDNANFSSGIIAEAETVGESTDIQLLIDDTVLSPEVDNEEYNYWIEIGSGAWASGTASNRAVSAVVIEYTIER